MDQTIRRLTQFRTAGPVDLVAEDLAKNRALSGLQPAWIKAEGHNSYAYFLDNNVEALLTFHHADRRERR